MITSNAIADPRMDLDADGDVIVIESPVEMAADVPTTSGHPAISTTPVISVSEAASLDML